MAFATGIHLAILAGSTVPRPVSAAVARAISSVEVTHSDAGASGFQIGFRAGRGQPYDLIDYPLLRGTFAPFTRVVLALRTGLSLHVLSDGMVTDIQAAPTDELITITGEDVSVMLDLHETTGEHPAQNEAMIAEAILAEYMRYGITPEVIPPPSVSAPSPTDRIPMQRGTDLAYLRELAARYNYEFFITPGPVPLQNQAYWGPPKRVGIPQPALSYDMGAATNVSSLNIRHDGLAAETVHAHVQGRETNVTAPVIAPAATLPPLARDPATLRQRHTRRALLHDSAGLTDVGAEVRAEAQVNRASSAVVTVDGSVDALRYGHILQARGIVGVRGVGQSYDGLYYVRQVTHRLQPADQQYQQSFTLVREGPGATTPIVRP